MNHHESSKSNPGSSSRFKSFARAAAAALVCGLSGCAAHSEGHSLDLDQIGIKGALTMQESEVFDLDEASLAPALDAVGALERDLTALHEPAARDVMLVRVSIDGSVMLEKRIPVAAIPDAAGALQAFANRVQLSAAQRDDAQKDDGVAVQAAALRDGWLRSTGRLLAWLAPDDNDEADGNATIGVRG